MPKRQQLSYADLYARERERVLDQHAKMRAGIEGRPAGGTKPNDDLEAMAWNNKDDAVTPEHLNEIAMQTVQELMAEKDPIGQPLWDLEQIEEAVKYRQTMAVYPWRHLTFETGVPEDDYEGKVKAADRAAKRYGQPVMPAIGQWSEPIDEAEAVAAIGVGGQGQTQPMAQPQAQAPDPAMMEQEPMGQEGVV